MNESQQNMGRLQYNYQKRAWRAELIGGKEHMIVYQGERGNLGNRLPEVIRLMGIGQKWLPGPKPEVRPATSEETLLLIEAIPNALKQVRDETSLRLHGTADLQQAQALTERLMEEAGKKLKLEDQTRRLSQVRDSLATEGLIYKKEQA